MVKTQHLWLIHHRPPVETAGGDHNLSEKGDISDDNESSSASSLISSITFLLCIASSAGILYSSKKLEKNTEYELS